MEKYYEFYYNYWRSNYKIDEKNKKLNYFYKSPNKNLDKIFENDRKNKKI